MPRGYDPNKFRRITTLVSLETDDRITSTAFRLGVLRETFIREAIEERLRTAEQTNG